MDKTAPLPPQSTVAGPIKKVVVDTAELPSLRFYTNKTGEVIVNAGGFAQAKAALEIPLQTPQNTVLYPINAANVHSAAQNIVSGNARLITDDESKGLISMMSAPPLLAELLHHIVKAEPHDPHITHNALKDRSDIRKKDGALIFRAGGPK